MSEMRAPSLGWEDPLEKWMATHSSIRAQKFHGQRGDWWATVHGVAKSRTWLVNWAQAHRSRSACPCSISIPSGISAFTAVVCSASPPYPTTRKGFNCLVAKRKDTFPGQFLFLICCGWTSHSLERLTRRVFTLCFVRGHLGVGSPPQTLTMIALWIPLCRDSPCLSSPPASFLLLPPPLSSWPLCYPFPFFLQTFRKLIWVVFP